MRVNRIKRGVEIKKAFNEDCFILHDVELNKVNIDLLILSKYGVFIIEVKSKVTQKSRRQAGMINYLFKSALKETLPGVKLPVKSIVIEVKDGKSVKFQLREFFSQIKSSQKLMDTAFLEKILVALSTKMVGPRGFEPRTYGL